MSGVGHRGDIEGRDIVENVIAEKSERAENVGVALAQFDLAVSEDGPAIVDALVGDIERLAGERWWWIKAQRAFFKNKTALVGDVRFADILSQRDRDLFARCGADDGSLRILTRGIEAINSGRVADNPADRSR